MREIKVSTVDEGLCIGCGLCSAICMNDAIHMQIGMDGDYIPDIETDKCKECGLCVKVCPNSIEALHNENKRLVESGDYLFYGVNSAKCFVGNVKNIEMRKKSTSGGIATFIAKKMLKTKMVDAVIHAKNIETFKGKVHYFATCSVSEEEIEENRGTIYAAVTFDKQIREICENGYKKILFIGTPCVVRGMQSYVKYTKNIDVLYTIALACSHNVCNLFTDYMGETLGITEEIEYRVNFRDKYDISNSNSFNTYFYNNNGLKICKNRFASEFSNQWRGYSFSKSCCNACSDFWGYSSDISLKDAWGKWSNNKYGKNIVVVRNLELLKLLDDEEVELTKVLAEDVVISQKDTIDYKQKKSSKKMQFTHGRQFDRIDLLHYMHALNREYSKKVYCSNRKNKLKRINIHTRFIVFICRILNNQIIKGFFE